MSQKRRLESALINLTLAVGELFVLLNYGFGWLGTMGAKGWDTFRFYTNDSNILLGIACLVYGVADLLVLRHPEKKIPKAISLFRLVATASVTITFLTVMAFLAPTIGWFIAFDPVYFLWVHTLFPILAIVSEIFLDLDCRFRIVDNLWSFAATTLYAGIIVPLVSTGVIEDPYGFTNVTAQPWYMSVLVFVLLPGGSFGVSLLLAWLRSLVLKKHPEISLPSQTK